MARAALGWTANDLAGHASIGVATVNRFETGQGRPSAVTIVAMQRALEAGGIQFVENGAVLTNNFNAASDAAAPAERNRLFQDDPSLQSKPTDSPPNPTRGRSRALAPDDEHR